MGPRYKLVIAFLWLAGVARAEYGFPAIGAEEGRLFQFHGDSGVFRLVAPQSVEAWHLYVRWDGRIGNWVWVVGRDRGRRVLGGSKVQGGRLGMSKKWAVDWFTLQPNNEKWRRVTDRRHPHVWVDDPVRGTVVSERCPDDWVNWGGTVDPLPAVPTTPNPPPPGPLVPVDKTPRCVLTASPQSVILGEAVLLTLSVSGQVTEALIEDVAVELPAGRRLVISTKVGVFEAKAVVKGPKGQGQCSARYEVTAP